MTAGVVFSTPWFDLVAEHANDGPYYVIQSPDCVIVLAVTTESNFLLVRQYRTALKKISLELPGGNVDAGDSDPEAAARRELLEETGYDASHMHFLGLLDPDPGRLRYRIWGFFASGAVKSGCPEQGVEVVECSPAELLRHVREAQLSGAQDLAVLLLAMYNGRLSLPGGEP